MANKPAPSSNQADLVLANTVSRLGCTVAEARKILARGSAGTTDSPASPTPQPPASKSDAPPVEDAALL